MSSAIFRSRLSERTVNRTRRVLRVRQMVCVRVLMSVSVVCVRAERRVGGVSVRQPRLGMSRAQVSRAAMVLSERQRRAGRPPVHAFLHLRPRGASRCAATRAAPGTRQRMPPRLVRAPVLTLAARHPFRWPLPLSLASPPRGEPPTAHRIIRTNANNSLFLLLYHFLTLKHNTQVSVK
ncbi:unnamed protein product [Euphydryas editha]|uniref:Uncharacterized protein n=1 Tax=Euphydryas editha TaxID=104508 RepID=A0AAU9TF28_EUPED|nr:unnamed protein product [Euphydryas editha]